MAKTTNETQLKLSFLTETFTEKDYNDYINGIIKYNDLCTKYDCSDYIMSTFFKQNNFLKRRELRKNNIKETIFDNINCIESAYIFGFYMADGCITKDNKFQININEKDLDLLTKIRDYISPISKLNYKPLYTNNKTGITTNPMYSLSFKCDHIANTLNTYNCGYNKTYIDKSIKDIVPKKFMWDFIRGYFDGDGCISSSKVVKKHKLKDGKCVEYTHTNVIFKITSKTKKILDELQDFFISEGINILVYPDKTCFTIGNHSLKDLKSIYYKLYNDSNLFMKRKQIKFKEIIENTEVN